VNNKFVSLIHLIQPNLWCSLYEWYIYTGRLAFQTIYACVRACVRACMRGYVCVCMYIQVCMLQI